MSASHEWHRGRIEVAVEDATNIFVGMAMNDRWICHFEPALPSNLNGKGDLSLRESSPKKNPRQKPRFSVSVIDEIVVRSAKRNNIRMSISDLPKLPRL